MRRFANLGQWLGLLAIIAGMVCLVCYREGIAAMVITASSLFYAISTKLKYYNGRKKLRQTKKHKGTLTRVPVAGYVIDARSIFRDREV
jgi:hypothetical protein